jgi:hypothetical protein
MVRVERHGFFLINVLAGLDCGNEIQGVLVLWSGNQHSIDALVIEQLPEVAVGFDVGKGAFHLVEAAGVNVGHGDALNVWAAQSGPEDLLTAASTPDQTNSDAVVGS